jgi:hypothetical protein
MTWGIILRIEIAGDGPTAPCHNTPALLQEVDPKEAVIDILVQERENKRVAERNREQVPPPPRPWCLPSP